jgi:hypothetical protein
VRPIGPQTTLCWAFTNGLGSLLESVEAIGDGLVTCN